MATASKSSNTTIRTSQRHQSATNTPPMHSHNQRNNTPQENTSSSSNKSSQLKRKTSSSSPETRDERAVAEEEQRTNIIIEHQRSSLVQHPLPLQPPQHPTITKYTDQAQLQPPAKKSRASTCLPTTCSTITHRSPPPLPLPQLPILFHHPLSHYSYLSSTSSNINNSSNSSYMSSSHHRLSPPPLPLQTTITTIDNSTSNKTSKTSNSDLNYQSRQSLFFHHPHFFSRPQIQPNTSKNSELNVGGANNNFLNCDYILF